MKIGVLSQKKSLYSTRRLVEAAKQRGHEVRVIDPLRCYMNITSHHPAVHYKGKLLDDLDAVIPRIGASILFYGTALVRQFETIGIFTLNQSDAIACARDKLRSLQLLSCKGIGLPITGFAHAPDDIKGAVKMVGGAPLVIKLLEGTQGIGVVLTETNKAAESVIDAFWGLQANILIQEYIKEAGGTDIRCFVIGSKVVAAMQRHAREGEFRANLHRGGSAGPVTLTSEERVMAIRAAKVIGLNVAGVDILRSDRGPLVIEVNSTPGLEGIEASSGKDIAGAMIEFIEQNARSRNPTVLGPKKTASTQRREGAKNAKVDA
jgi:ribosomal protein S6--L-glutamate ligase